MHRPHSKTSNSSTKNASSSNARIYPQIIKTGLIVFVLITLYEYLKQLLYPGITIWQSHIVTIIIVTIAAMIVAYSVVHRRRLLLRQFRVEQGLHEEQEKFRIIADFTYDWEYWIDNQRRLVYMSPSCERITGYPTARFLSDPQFLASITHPDDRARVMNHFDEKSDLEVGELEYRIIRSDGQVRWISHLCQPVTGKDGRSLGRRVSNRDISKRKNAENELRKSQELYRVITRNLPDSMVMVVDPSMNLLLTEGTLKSFEDTALTKKGQRPHHILTDKMRSQINTRFGFALAGQEHAYESSLYGRTFWSKYVPIRDEENNVIAALSMIMDVTERKRTEELLEQSRILDRVDDAIIATDNDNNIRYMNKAAFRQYEIESDEPVIGKNIHDIHDFEWVEADQEELAHKALENEGLWKGLNIHITRSGKRMWVESVVSVIKSPSGEPIGMIAVIRDTTDRKNLEDDCLKAANQLAAANKELEAFSYSVSHDLRSPLNNISALSTILLDEYAEVLGDTGRDYLHHISDNVFRMKTLIEDILGLSKISFQKLHRQNTDLSDIARSIIEEFRSSEPEREVRVIIEDGLGVTADPGLMRVALTNLLGNAWKYTGKTEYPRIHLGSCIQNDERVFFVADNGPGFDASKADKLFVPFQRLHSDREFTGTGIGLPIVNRVILRHEGRIWAKTKPGEGTTFFFTIGE